MEWIYKVAYGRNQIVNNYNTIIMENITLLNKEVEVLRLEVSNRGGGIEINLTPFGFEYERMAAYQNYLGGGMLGAVQVNDTIHARGEVVDEDSEKLLTELGEELKKYFHNLTNEGQDEWGSSSYEENQSRAASAY